MNSSPSDPAGGILQCSWPCSTPIPEPEFWLLKTSVDEFLLFSHALVVLFPTPQQPAHIPTPELCSPRAAPAPALPLLCSP